MKSKSLIRTLTVCVVYICLFSFPSFAAEQRELSDIAQANYVSEHEKFTSLNAAPEGAVPPEEGETPEGAVPPEEGRRKSF